MLHVILYHNVETIISSSPHGINSDLPLTLLLLLTLVVVESTILYRSPSEVAYKDGDTTVIGGYTVFAPRLVMRQNHDRQNFT